MALTDRRLTAQEYMDRPPEDRFTQLVDGEIVVTEANLRHQEIVLYIARRLAEWTEAAPGRGRAGIPVNVFLGEGNVFAPDVWWVSEERRPLADALGLDGPPDLAVEVRSPSTWRYDIGAKKTTYERHGLPELWLVDTESETVLVYRRSSPAAPDFDVALELGAGEALTSSALPGFSLAVEASGGAFVTVLIGTQPICYHYREDLSADRVYTEVACDEDGRLEPALVTDPGETATMGSAGSSRLRPAAAASGAVLVVVGLGGGWVLAAPRGAQAERRRPAAPPRRPTARRESRKSTST